MVSQKTMFKTLMAKKSDWFCSVLLVAAVVVIGMPKCKAQVAASPTQMICAKLDENPGPLTLGRKLAGLDCERCHNQPPREEGWILANEESVWRERDRHSQAFLTLLGDRSRRMGVLLGVENIHEDGRCLACHSTLPAEWLKDKQTVTKTLERLSENAATEQLLTKGVSCEACHGAYDSNGEMRGWREAHVGQDWKFLSGQSKQADFGFYDVRSPSSRAAMCSSCHVGDPARGRLVTHEMYAAGHPPLPSFEVETFTHDMPPHWRRLGTSDARADASGESLATKPRSISLDFLQKSDDEYVAGLRKRYPRFFDSLNQDGTEVSFEAISFERTRALAVGAIATWAQSARATAALTGAESLPLTPVEASWPELASFDCSACHHDLSLSAWRAKRMPPTTPGRPVLRDSSSPLFVAVCRAFPDGSDAAAKLADFEAFRREATRTSPYGDRSAINSNYQDAANWAKGLAAKLELQLFRRGDAMRLLQAIALVGAESPHDYESARQLFWAFQVVLQELDSDDAQWREVRSLLDQSKQLFVTDLAAGELREPAEVSYKNQTYEVELVDLKQVLPSMANYDAFETQRLFEQLAELTARRSQ